MEAPETTPLSARPVEQVEDIATEAILPNPRQPRRHFRPEQIQSLASSIASQGVIQPIIVRPHPTVIGCFELVAGERRLRALRQLGRSRAPVLVRHIPDDDLLEAALVENLQREQLTPIEEAQAYQDLLALHGYTQETLAERVGKDRSTIANMIRLLALPMMIQQDLEEEKLSVGHARALLAVGDRSEQLELRNRVLAAGLSVRETEKLVHQARRTPSAHQTKQDKNQSQAQFKFIAAQEILEARLGTRVSINTTDGEAGRLEIQFYSHDDFNRLFDLLRGR